jgi:hypothetical protein
VKFFRWVKGWCEDIPWMIRVARGKEDPYAAFFERLGIPQEQQLRGWDGKFPGQER